MMRTLLLSAGTLLALTLAVADARAESIPKPIAAAVADSARPDADKQRDADRKPAESVAFAGLKPGDKVADLLPGRGYFTRIFSGVVGSKGHVFAVAPPRRPNAPADSPDPAAAVQAIAADAHYSNVSVIVGSPTQLALPEKVDLIWTSQNYHDVHNLPNADMAAFNKVVLDGLKPGGTYIVLDHAAEAGSGTRDTSSLHRIDPEVVKKEVTAVGFKFESASKILVNAKDPHTANVHDGSIKGTTDQFILKFRKPK